LQWTTRNEIVWWRSASACSTPGTGATPTSSRRRSPQTWTTRAIFNDHRTAAYVAKVREVRELAGRRWHGTARETELNPVLNAIQSVVAVRQVVA
jgi:hypothetical protein